MISVEQIRCDCHGRQKIIAERDDDGNVYVQCRGCREKVKIEPKGIAPGRKKLFADNPTVP